MKPLKATVNCDLGEGFGLYRIGDDEELMKTIHLANVACGFHASDPEIMHKTISLAYHYSVAVGGHPSLPDLQGFGRREMKISADELWCCFVYQIGALVGFMRSFDGKEKGKKMRLNHIKPHGAVYGMMARDKELARVGMKVCKLFSSTNGGVGDGDGQVSFVGLAGTLHEEIAKEEGVKFIPEWFADLEYDEGGKLLITRKHDVMPKEVVAERVMRLLKNRLITTNSGNFIPLDENVVEMTICVHSDTPDAVEIARLVKSLVDEHNMMA